MGKGENAGYQHFLFSKWFLKASFSGSLKPRIIWQRVNPFPNKPCFLRVCRTSLLKSNFFFSYSIFYPFTELPTVFIKFKIVVSFSLEKSKKICLAKGLTPQSYKYSIYSSTEGVYLIHKSIIFRYTKP